MNINIQEDFQIRISVPLKLHKLTLSQPKVFFSFFKNLIMDIVIFIFIYTYIYIIYIYNIYIYIIYIYIYINIYIYIMYIH